MGWCVKELEMWSAHCLYSEVCVVLRERQWKEEIEDKGGTVQNTPVIGTALNKFIGKSFSQRAHTVFTLSLLCLLFRTQMQAPKNI